MDKSAAQQHIVDFIHQHHVLTLCTGNGSEMWCASCFYLFNAKEMALWLMTEPQTRHGRLMQQNGSVVGTIAPTPTDIVTLKGIQYCGKIERLSGDRERPARRQYEARFPMAQTMPAPVWQIDLQKVKMVDNTLGFGKKLHWCRESDALF